MKEFAKTTVEQAMAAAREQPSTEGCLPADMCREYRDPAQEVESRLSSINDRIAEAVAAVCSDPGASPVLRAVFEELLRKSESALTAVESCRYGCFRESVVELEQAADSARAAAVADEGAGERTQEQVLAAHDALRELKRVTRCEFARCDRYDGYCCRNNNGV